MYRDASFACGGNSKNNYHVAEKEDCSENFESAIKEEKCNVEPAIQKINNNNNNNNNNNDQNDKIIHMMRWGIPLNKALPNGPVGLSNTRVESLVANGWYKKKLHRRRCVLLSQGFFEWLPPKTSGGTKQGFYVRPSFDDKNDREAPLMMMAAYYEIFDPLNNNNNNNSCSKEEMEMMANASDESRILDNEPTLSSSSSTTTTNEGTSPLFAFSVITTESSHELSWLHDRMPALLHGAALDTWLDPLVSDEVAMQCLVPFQSGKLQWHAVPPLVNNVRNNSAECVERLEDWEQRRRQTGIARFFISNTNSKKNVDLGEKTQNPAIENKTSPASKEATNPSATSSTISEESIETLVGMGFERACAVHALTLCQGDVTQAMDYILALQVSEDDKKRSISQQSSTSTAKHTRLQ